MHIHIAAVGRLRNGPEKTLVDDYIARATKVGRSLKVGPVKIVEVDTCAALTRHIEKTEFCIALDEGGQYISSPEFSKILERKRDSGVHTLTFCIGAADGLSPEVRTAAHQTLSLGKMVWPHMLARVMLSEQIYRGISILADTPYHRA